jgi:putative iron-dependent peroxidase
MPQPQPAINLPRTRHAIFLIFGVPAGPAHAERARHVCGTVDALQRAVGARASEDALDCIVGIGSDVWERLCGSDRPRELHPFREVRSGPRVAPSTPGDIFLHVLSDDLGLCYELAAQITAQFGDSVAPIDEVHGFRYFDDRDLTGFVDGTENPTGAAGVAATIVGDEDAAFAGGSYIMVQKYLHDLRAWHRLTTETQEGIIGRTKLDDVELDDAVKPPFAHNALTSIEENGEAVEIVRHNMPFGNAGGGDAGTYFVGYARSPSPMETMLENMVIGKPPGNYDRLFDFTHPVTGNLFFAPSVELLASLATAEAVTASAPAEAAAVPSVGSAMRGDGSLNIGSLKGARQHE